MLAYVLLAKLAVATAAAPIMRGGCGDVDTPAPTSAPTPVPTPAPTPAPTSAWTDVSTGYTQLSFDGTTLCAIDTSSNFKCTTTPMTPASWTTAYTNVQSGLAAGNMFAVVSSGKAYVTTTGYHQGWDQDFSISTAVNVWGNMGYRCYVSTMWAQCTKPGSTANYYIHGDKMGMVASGDVLYGLDASGALFQGSLVSVFDTLGPMWASMAGAAPMIQVAAGGGYLCGLQKADATIACSTDNTTWSTLPGANWAHVAVFGKTVYATDSTNTLRSFSFS